MDTQNPPSKSLYNDRKNAQKYIESTDGIDGRFLIEQLKNHLEPGSTVLELGMGGGKDLAILNETFKAVGSDYSQAFLDIHKQTSPNADLLLLDAISLKTDRRFDCIFSNKVLHHLSERELEQSLKVQKYRLNRNGLLLHTFWNGVTKKKMQELHFNKYTLDELADLVENEYEIIEANYYEEMNSNDSIYLILKPH